MIKTIGVAVLLFFLQPLLWIGLLASWITAHRRIAYERKTLRVAIFKEKFEIKDYLTKGLVIGLGVSLIAFLVGMPVSFEFVVVYQVIALLLLVAGYRFLHPMFTFSISMLLLVGYYLFYPGTLPSFTFFNFNLFGEGMNSSPDMILPVLLLISVLTIGTGIQLMKTKKQPLSPQFSKTKRGKILAGYSLKPLWMIPLFLVLPGSLFTSVFPWWPVFKIGASTQTLLFFPVVFGMQYKIKTQVAQDATYKIGRDTLWVGGIALISAIGSFFFPGVGFLGLLLVLIGGILVLYRHILREKKWQFVYAPNEEGWKVVAIRPDTPGEKMELEPGETILECNQMTKEKNPDFYEALAANRVYCKLRIRRADGQIRLAETAIYDDASHDLGIVVIEDAPIL